MFKNSYIHKSGTIGEEIIIKYLDLIKGEKIIFRCHDKRFDVLTDTNIKYEIKTQYHTITSSSVYIELQSFNKPSGIITTESHVYIFLIPDLENEIFIYMKLTLTN
jgi:hypothetical protein